MDLYKPVQQENVSKEESVIDFNKIEKDSFVDISEQIQLPPVVLSIGETVKGTDVFPVPYGTEGNFSCLVGASKSRKTFLKSLLTGCYIGGKANNYADNIKSHRRTNKIILDFDTEQGKWHAQQTFRRPVELAGEVYENYLPFGLRQYDYKTRIDFIDFMIKKHKNNLGLVLIDGVADLVSDVNDLKQCNEAAQKLMEWTDLTQCHLICILHKNFGSSKPTGHLGSTVLKKAETIAFVEVDENDKSISNVKFEYTRSFAIEEFSFSVDNNWLPYLIDNSVSNGGFE